MSDLQAQREWVFFDGNCALCRSGAARWEKVLERHGFGLAPLQSPIVQARIGHPPGQAFTDIKLLRDNGEILSGVDVYAYVTKHLWWAAWFPWLADMPGMRCVLKRIYQWIARHRYCLGGACSIQQRHQLP